MPEVSRFYGIIIYMFYNEHNPPHFHAKYQNHEAIVEIDSGLVIGNMPKKAVNLIYEWVGLYKNDLLKNWQLLKNRKPVEKIEPLRK